MTHWDPNPTYPGGGQQPHDPGAGGAPLGGYTPPPQVQAQFADPLISPDYGGWWSRGVSIARRGWRPLAALQAVGVMLALLVEAPVFAYVALAMEDLNGPLARSDPNSPPDLAPLFGLLGLTLLTVLLIVIVTSVVTLAAVHVGVSVAVGGQTRVSEALLFATRRIFPLLGWELLTFPIYVVAVCLCFLPVFYVAAVFVVLPVVVAVERTNAISRCFSLFHRDPGCSVGRIATILGLSVASSVVASLIGGLADVVARAGLPGTGGIVGGSIVSTLLGALVGGAISILLAPLTLAAYADMRARVEPLNTMVIVQQLGIVPPWSVGAIRYG